MGPVSDVHPEDPQPDAGAERPAKAPRALRNRIILWTVLVVVLLGLAFLGATTVPRWWAQQVGGLSDGSLARSAWWGLAFGFVFTFLPVLVVAKAVRRWKGWRAPVTWVCVAVALAAPNLFTLWIVVGTSRAAHAAERTLDVSAPYFVAATAWSALLGVLAALASEVLWRSWRRRGRALKQLRDGDTPPAVHRLDP